MLQLGVMLQLGAGGQNEPRQGRVSPWWCQPLRRRWCLVLMAVALLHAAMVLHESWGNFPSVDEQAHMASALAHVVFGRFELYRVNPPVATLPAGWALRVLRPRMDWSCYQFGTPHRQEFEVGTTLAHLNTRLYRWLTFWARIAGLPWTLLGLSVCFAWGPAIYGPAAGLLAAVLWAFCPATVAHAAQITPDLAAAATGLLAGYAFWRWTRRPEAGPTLTLGLTLGLALSCKFTWVILPPLWGLLVVVWFGRQGLRTLAIRLGQMVTAFGVALLVFNAAYGFEDSFRPLGTFSFSSEPLAGASAQNLFEPRGNRFRETLLGKLPVPVPVPVPAAALRGVDLQKSDFESQVTSYMAGRWAEHRWWYYYLYAAGVKLPLGL